MMKNMLLKLLVVLLAIAMLMSASRPSIEGRASIAESGELPPGMYIKAHSFLPGDSVIVTNPATKVSLEAFVFATIDEGVAAIVSNEVAEKLFITENSDTIVQIRKVIAPDQIAETDLLLAEEQVVIIDATEEDFIDDSEVYVSEEVKVDVIAIDTPVSEVIEEEIPVEVAMAEDAMGEEVVTEEIIVEEVAIADIIVEEKILEETAENLTEESTEEIVQSTQDEVSSEEAVITEITDIIVSSENETAEEDIIFTPFSDMTALFSSEYTTETAIEENLDEEIPATEVIESVEDHVAPVIELGISEEPVLEEVIEVVMAEEIITETSTPNVLIPTEENPPMIEEKIEESEVVTYTDFTADVLEVEEPVETIDIFAFTPAVEVIEPSVIEYDVSEYIVDSLSSKGNKKYYIQLATYKDIKNIDSILTAYSEKYPFALVNSSVISDAYQVLIGPLNKDEYTVVLERFKSYGYKDAFLRIAN